MSRYGFDCSWPMTTHISCHSIRCSYIHSGDDVSSADLNCSCIFRPHNRLGWLVGQWLCAFNLLESATNIREVESFCAWLTVLCYIENILLVLCHFRFYWSPGKWICTCMYNFASMRLVVRDTNKGITSSPVYKYHRLKWFCGCCQTSHDSQCFPVQIIFINEYHLFDDKK